jgi:hypothetical protein
MRELNVLIDLVNWLLALGYMNEAEKYSADISITKLRAELEEDKAEEEEEPNP